MSILAYSSSLLSSPSPSPTMAVSTTESSDTGTIVGCVGGGLVFVAIIFAILFSWRQRSSRQPASRDVTVGSIGRKGDHSRQITKTHHGPSESTDTMLSAATSASHPDIRIEMPVSPPISKGDYSPRMEKGFAGNGVVTALPKYNRPASLRNHRPRSTPGNGNLGKPESGDFLEQCWNSNRYYRPIDRTPSSQHQRKSDTFFAMVPLPVETRLPGEFYSPSSGQRAFRKPAPTYDASEFDMSTSNGDTSLKREDVHLVGLGAEHDHRSIYYLIPDILPPVKD